MRELAYLAVLALVACGDNLKPGPANPGGDAGSDAAIDGPVDAAPKLDAAIDAPPAPETITITGVAIERTINGAVPVASATVAAFFNADEAVPVVTTTTDAQGQFTLVVPTGGLAIDGFLKATKTGLKDTYLYPATFVTGDLAMVPIQMVTPGNYDALSVLGQGNQMPGMGLIALQVLDGPPPGGVPVGGAKVSSAPLAGAYRYNAMNGLPSSLATETHTDGVAYMFNVPPGSVDVSAAKAGLTFATHSLKAWPDALTTTFIQP